MAIVTTDSANYTAIADAIRAKGVEGNFQPGQMAAAIASIQSGGSGGDLFTNAKFYKDTGVSYKTYAVAPDDLTENSTILIWSTTIKQNTSSTKYGVVWGGVLPRALYLEGINLSPDVAPLSVMGLTDQTTRSYATIGLPTGAKVTSDYSNSAFPDFLKKNGIDLQVVDGEKRLTYLEQRYTSSTSTPGIWDEFSMIYIP